MQWMDVPGPDRRAGVPDGRAATPAGRPDAPEPEPALLGDIVLCPEVAAKQAATAGHSHGRRAARCSPCTACCTCSATTTPSPTRSARCSGCSASCSRAGGRAGEAASAGDRRPGHAGLPDAPATLLRRGRARPGRARRRLFAATDAALSTVSPARAEELARDERPRRGRAAGASSPTRPRYINLLLLLRMPREITATVLVAVVVARACLGARLAGCARRGRRR